MKTLPECFQHTVITTPADHGLVVDRDHYSFHWLEERSAQIAQWLLIQGAHPGDVVAVYLPNGIELALIHLAVMRFGGIALPLNTKYTPRELEFILQDAQAAVFFGDGFSSEWCDALQAKVPQVRLWLDVTQRAMKHVLFEQTHPLNLPPIPRDAEAIAIICYTSGTTGHPKGAQLSHRNIVFGVQTLLSQWRVTASDRFLLALPLFHVHGLMLGLFGSFLFGHQTWIRRYFQADEVLAQLISENLTLFMGVPTMYARFLKSSYLKRLRNTSMRLFTSGSAPLSRDVFQAFQEVTGHTIVERYGLTETLINSSNPYDAERRPGTVGFPLPGISLEIRNDVGQPVASEQVGGIYVKGPNVFRGYLNRPELDQEIFHEGWFATKDLGRFDQDGYLEIVGRLSELILVGGYNVYPKEVEQVIAELPHIREVAIVGKIDDDLGEHVHAVVVQESGGNWEAQTLIEACRDILAKYKLPQSVEFRDALPRNALGKVQKHLL